MIVIVLVITCLISFFFSLIFSTSVFQHKRWNHIYISLSFLLISFTLFSLIVGQLLNWYQWVILLFIFSFSMLGPSMFGFLWETVVQRYAERNKRYYSIFYAIIYSVLMITYFANVLYLEEVVLIVPQGIQLQWVQENLVMYSWITGISTILFILGSLFLWLRKQGNTWIWCGLAGCSIF
ncbi:hypothetical protein [Caldalkalibacillus mannanilyticus]|uniref:hypothetical protein n=1 Tax=Caldalkalibacillus mannanilyticus TaxID=1418 RepID=UPI000469E2AC|nr:hypothetical protein [Caldalkalibacillus mannanilyticus]